jgi:DNA-binding IclR family transcriptional regulator
MLDMTSRAALRAGKTVRGRKRAEVPQHAGRGYGRLIDLLELLAFEADGSTGSDIGRRLGLPKSTMFVLLQYLVERGVVSLDPRSRRYSTGPVLVELAHQIVGGLALVRAARPYLETLSLETGEDAYLGVRHGTQFVYVDKVEGVQSVQLNLRLGAPRPLHSTGPGKLLLAFGPAGLLDQVAAERGLPMITPATITDIGRLRRELSRIRERGYSISESENVEGIYALAAPVRDHSGCVIASVSIATPYARGIARREVLAGRVCAAARGMSRYLGCDAGQAGRGAR